MWITYPQVNPIKNRRKCGKCELYTKLSTLSTKKLSSIVYNIENKIQIYVLVIMRILCFGVEKYRKPLDFYVV